MSEKIERLKRILEQKQKKKKEIARQIREHRKIQRRLNSLIKTAEKKKYTYRPELVVVDDWLKQTVDSLRAEQKENNKKIFVGKGLIEIARLSYLLEVIERNPHIDY